MKILLMIKLGIVIKKILNTYGVNLRDYLFTENALLIGKDIVMMKQYLDNKNNLTFLRLNLSSELSKAFQKRNEFQK